MGLGKLRGFILKDALAHSAVLDVNTTPGTLHSLTQSMAMLSGNAHMSSARAVGMGGHEQSTPLCTSENTRVTYRRNNHLVRPRQSVPSNVLGSPYTMFWDAETIAKYDVLVFNRGECDDVSVLTA